ncbi:ankyrin repeat-containing domain protein, partial [Baffinella frigidus]
AAMLGKTAEVLRLLEDGADVEEENPTGHTALHIAVLQRHGGIVRLLLDHGAGVNTQAANDGATPLHCAAEPGHGDMFQLLLDNGADFNLKTNSGDTVLLTASEPGHDAIVQQLLDLGADVNAQ